VRRRVVATVLLAALVIAWSPLLRPAGQGAILLLDIYSSLLWERDLAALITPRPRTWESPEPLANAVVRTSWWRPGWGDRHPGVLLVNGATAAGNDDVVTRRFGEALARAGYLVMLPEFPFLKEGRLDRAATAQVDAAFASLRAREETVGKRVGAFGASVGGGVLLAAAGSQSALAQAEYLVILGGYFDLDTYLARERLRAALRAGGGKPAGEPPADLHPDARSLWSALAAPDHAAALARLAALPTGMRATIDELSPATNWSAVRPPVFWIHDIEDRYEPVAEAFAAESAPRDGRFRLFVPRLLSHAAPLASTGERSAAFLISELWNLLGFAIEVIRLAG
jgi:dienelactone hydrolase